MFRTFTVYFVNHMILPESVFLKNVGLCNLTAGVMCNYFCSLKGYRVETGMRAPCWSGNFSGTLVRRIAQTRVYRSTLQADLKDIGML
jgi:hypothetical protein